MISSTKIEIQNKINRDIKALEGSLLLMESRRKNIVNQVKT